MSYSILDQPADLCSLIRAFAGHLSQSSSSVQFGKSKLLSEYVDAKIYLNNKCAHMS